MTKQPRIEQSKPVLPRKSVLGVLFCGSAIVFCGCDSIRYQGFSILSTAELPVPADPSNRNQTSIPTVAVRTGDSIKTERDSTIQAPVGLPVIQREAASSGQRRIAAQGRILPAGGIVQIGATPGDRIDQIFVSVGDMVARGESLALMASEEVARQEIEALEVRRKIVEQEFLGQTLEAEVGLETAIGRKKQAEQQVRQAQFQVEQAKRSGGQIDNLRGQIDRLREVRHDPRTKLLVGAIELEKRELELERAELDLERALAAAEIAVEGARVGLEVASQAVASAKKVLEGLALGNPVDLVEAQIAAAKAKLEAARVMSPISGKVLAVHSRVGERTAGMPMMEIANLEAMVCNAEVHEVDVSRLRVGNRVRIESPALERPISGRVARIDSIVGVPQMRSPNPMARTDFRSVPVLIEIADEDTSIAGKTVQLQVDVTILIGDGEV